jgi:stage V sporulation protein D (sporulation-specific penicillin-binding protein)
MNTNILMRKRIAELFLLMAGILFLLIFRLGWLQFVRGEELQQKALDNRLREVPVEAKRGVIYDRNKNELAVSISADSIGVFPAEIKHSGRAEEIAKELAEILKMPYDKVYSLITKNSSFVWVKRKVDFEVGPQIKKLNLPGVEVIEESQRYYPNGTLAAHLLGFAGIDNQGLEGLEVTHDEILSGKKGKILIEFDATNREIPEAVHRYIPPEDGNSIVLTIDETIQYIVERELDNLIAQTQAKSATIIVMDPKTGGILALGNRPTYDPNKYAESPQDTWRNIAVSNSYEPGSTFKIITAATSLEEAVTSENDRFYDPGYIKVGDRRIKCWRAHNPHGSQTFVEGVQNSCNPVFVELGLRLEAKEKGLLYDYIKAFGFGQKTGVGIRGEATGIMIPEDQLKQINIATIAMGQSIAVTPLQLVRAVSAIANGGKLMKPRVVQEVRDKDGNLVQEFAPEVERQVISTETANKICEILEGVVSKGTGRNAYIPGYRVGGKTGTAQKPGPGGYIQGKYVASFIGLAPVNDPRIVCLVVVDEPQGVYYGGQIAAPVFKKVVEDSLRYLGVAPQYDEGDKNEKGSEVAKQVAVPELVGLPTVQAVKAIQAAGLKYEIQGEGTFVVKQTPAGGAKVSVGTKVILYTGEQESKGGKVVIPDVTGLRISETALLLEALGLELIPVGTGKAVEQDPIPLTEVPKGSKIKVIFTDEQVVETLGP